MWTHVAGTIFIGNVSDSFFEQQLHEKLIDYYPKLKNCSIDEENKEIIFHFDDIIKNFIKNFNIDLDSEEPLEITYCPKNRTIEKYGSDSMSIFSVYLNKNRTKLYLHSEDINNLDYFMLSKTGASFAISIYGNLRYCEASEVLEEIKHKIIQPLKDNMLIEMVSIIIQDSVQTIEIKQKFRDSIEESTEQNYTY